MLGLLILVFVAMYVTKSQYNLGNNLDTTQQVESQAIRARINNALLNIELADDDNEKNIGLGGRRSLASDSGMLFVYDKEGIYRYWMKGMLIPIDIIWIKDGEIVDITTNVPPPNPGTLDSELKIYQPRASINRVLETNAGFVDTNQIQIGDKIHLEN